MILEHRLSDFRIISELLSIISTMCKRKHKQVHVDFVPLFRSQEIIALFRNSYDYWYILSLWQIFKTTFKRKTVENLLENFLATQCSKSQFLVQKFKVMKMGQFWQFEFSCLNWLFFGAQNVWILPDKIGVFQFIHLWFFRQNLVFGMKNQTFRTFLAPKLKFFY